MAALKVVGLVGMTALLAELLNIFVRLLQVNLVTTQFRCESAIRTDAPELNAQGETMPSRTGT